jgi:hypothetical protein
MRREFSRLKPVFLASAALMLLAGPLRAAGGVSAADESAIQSVINAQVDAFRHDDGAKAYGFATPELQTMFGSASHFMDMVRRAYQPVYRPRSYTFGKARVEGDQIAQDVTLIGPDGLPHLALYTMEHEPDGSWKIAGCQLIERPSLDS